jgi:endonuclease YncB( thermonuclease family)
MPNITKFENDYKSLKTDLQTLLSTARDRAEEALKKIAVTTHWEIGQRLAKTINDTGNKTSTNLVTRLANDLQINKTMLYRSFKFFRTYPDGLPDSRAFQKLPWASHVELLPLHDPDERQYYADLAAKEDWSRDKLRSAIKADLYNQTRGARNRGSKELMKRPKPGLYTYEAEVERVVDGDTLVVRLDLGFDVLKRERVRLRGLDAPEIKTDQGQKAKRFVERKLKGDPKVVLRTYWHDKYGRYVADVFLKGDQIDKDDAVKVGLFLNQEMVSKGVAKKSP